MGRPDHALLGYYARAAQHAPLKAVLGTKPGVGGAPARVLEGWLTDIKARTGAWITYFVPTGSPIRGGGNHTIRLQCNIWVFAAPGGNREALRASIDEAHYDLFDQAHWQYSGTRLYSYWLAFSDVPAGPDEPIGRRRDLIIEVT